MPPQVDDEASRSTVSGEDVSIPLKNKVLLPFLSIVEAVTWGRNDESLRVIKSGWEKGWADDCLGRMGKIHSC